jgi:hypothetical protein
MMATEINILMSVDLEGRRQACIQVISGSWKSKLFMMAVFLKT